MNPLAIFDRVISKIIVSEVTPPKIHCRGKSRRLFQTRAHPAEAWHRWGYCSFLNSRETHNGLQGGWFVYFRSRCCWNLVFVKQTVQEFVVRFSHFVQTRAHPTESWDRCGFYYLFESARNIEKRSNESLVYFRPSWANVLNSENKLFENSLWRQVEIPTQTWHHRG